MWLLFLVAARLPPTMTPDEVVAVETVDGWRNDLRHYAGPGPPVLLVHGLGANHYNFDWREEVSLADALVDAGWDVWIPELRGDPGSVPPDALAARAYTFDDHARLDVPAAIRAVLDRTGRDRLYWVGHSMGGMLLYATLAQEPDKVAAGVAICSPSTFEAHVPGSWWVRGLGFALGGSRRIPASDIGRAAAVLGVARPLTARLANPDNLDPRVARSMARDALVDLTTPMARLGLAWIASGTFASADGQPWLVPADVPVLVLAAPADKVVGVENVRATCDVLPDCTFRLLGATEGFSSDYGHIDPVVGVNAREEVYPVVLEFLAGHGPQQE